MNHYGIFYNDSPQWESITIIAKDLEQAMEMISDRNVGIDISDAEIRCMKENVTDEMGRPYPPKVKFND